MPEQLEYAPPMHHPRWSIVSIVGFVLCLVGPIIGLAFALKVPFFDTLAPEWALFLLVIASVLPGIALSTVGFVQTGSDENTKRGGAFATAGLIIALLWVFVIYPFLFLLSLTLMDP